VRERTAELAILKAIGFSDRFVMLLVLAESLIIAAIGGGLGLALAKGLTVLLSLGANPLANILPFSYLAAQVLLTGLGVALAFGAASGFLPAIGALRLRVVEGLRRV
jgi:putative ABC transport system permease protein